MKMTAFSTSAGCSPSVKRTALIRRYWQRNAAAAVRALLDPMPLPGNAFDLNVLRHLRGKLVADRFVYIVETRQAPAGAAHDVEFRIVCEGLVVEHGRYYAIDGAVH